MLDSRLNKRVLVTGASRGIGRAIAIDLAKAGHRIAVNYRTNQDAAKQTLEAIHEAGGKGELLQFDIADRAGTAKILAAELEASGPFWGVVCNAGTHADAPFPILTGDEWDRVIHTNLDGFYNVLRPLVLPMVQAREGGRIVTLSSLSGLIGNRGQTNYAAAKAGIIAATKSLSQELAKRKITVNSVAPGLIETDMTKDVPKDMVMSKIPMRRFGTPAEVAGLVTYLFSEIAGYITGQVISVNGGMI